MTGPRFAILLCVLLIQRATTQTPCQSDLYVSINDILRVIGSNQQGISIGQESCGCQANLPVINQACGCGQGLINQPNIPLAQNSLGCGGSILPSLSIGQPGLSLLGEQGCGCNPSISAANLQGITLNQNLGCGGSILPSLSIGQPGLSLLGQQGCGQSLPFNLPSISASEGLGCGCQQPLIGNFGLGNLQSVQPSLSLNGLLPACGQQGIGLNQPCPGLASQIGLQTQNLGNYGLGGNVGSFVPTAVALAPPYGIVFTGENLIIEGAVQVCGSMPFTSGVQVAGALPTVGSGYVNYVCNDFC